MFFHIMILSAPLIACLIGLLDFATVIYETKAVYIVKLLTNSLTILL